MTERELLIQPNGVNLAAIPEDKYSDYRYDVIFKAYKWDPQVQDNNTVSRHAVILTRETAKQLEEWAEQLAAETVLMEEALAKNLHLAAELGLPRKVRKVLGRLSGYVRENNVRLMRFDFHPTETGWAVSEVNSDVPGGLAEASVWPKIAAKYFNGPEPGNNTAEILFKAFEGKVKKGGSIAFVHATSYSDDRQVMQFLSDYFYEHGFDTFFAAPDHLRWNDKKAISILEGRKGAVDGIVRFFPLEWLVNLPVKSNWKGYYDCETPSCNHPIAIFAQSKRLPLVWDKLGVEIPAWKKLLPETADPKSVRRGDGEWIYKPALGRVGEGISIKGAVSEKELLCIERTAHRFPKDWVAQRMFKSRPIATEEGEKFHLCIGAFTVDGKCAGFYGRISPHPRIDDKARDIPLLVIKGGDGDDERRPDSL